MKDSMAHVQIGKSRIYFYKQMSKVLGVPEEQLIGLIEYADKHWSGK